MTNLSLAELLHAGLLASAVGLSGCQGSQGCTLIGCGEAVTIEIDSERWEHGTYALALSESGRSFACSITHPAPDSGGAAGAAGAAGVVPEVRQATCEQTAGAPADIAYDQPRVGFDPPLTIRLPRKPSTSLALKLEREGETLVDEAFWPRYKTSYPNGPDCGKCQTARVELSFTPPSSP